MASVFKKDLGVQNRPVIDIVRDSLDVDSDGNVQFRSRTGRGSGKAIQIPASEFDEFVNLMIKTRESRENLAKQQREMDDVSTHVACDTGGFSPVQ